MNRVKKLQINTFIKNLAAKNTAIFQQRKGMNGVLLMKRLVIHYNLSIYPI